MPWRDCSGVRLSVSLGVLRLPDLAASRALVKLRYFAGMSADEAAEAPLGDYPAVQYVPPSGDFHLDILTRLAEAFHFADLEIDTISWDGLEVRVVSARTLYRMKKDTVRLKDRADAELLRERFDLEDDN